MAEAKIIFFWFVAICAAALIEPVKENMRIEFKHVEITEKETQLIDQMEQLNNRIDSLTETIMKDSCRHDIIINL